ncbi:hypothetical protein [Methylopila sp. 73B]|uniref:hypothetical protein n=1 Tax=Methylopila sp. 73B TaxID=1120792 RepID=UPI0003646B95|nr:hypothetical protein [Methylopila sp. 73B]
MTDQIVSDHAVLRFLERVYQVDVEACRAQIADATAAGREAGALVGSPPQFAIVIARVRFVVSRGAIVTALARDWSFCPRGYRRRNGHLTR